MVVGTALGAVITRLAGTAPGAALGVLVVASTAVAVFAVAPQRVHAVIPAPALCYVVAAIGTGYLSDRAASLSRAAFALGVVQWVAAGFLAMTIGTVLAVAVAAARRPATRRSTRRAAHDPRRAARQTDHGQASDAPPPPGMPPTPSPRQAEAAGDAQLPAGPRQQGLGVSDPASAPAAWSGALPP